tara:strand:+ start:825 stop:1403 length:579 start_codon:yes stop_codon:yes gene_type:complete
MKIFYSALGFGLTISTGQVFGAQEGMPQLNPEYWVAQVFWLTLTFAFLYFVIWKIFLPKITSNIENRKSKIINDLNEAQKLKENAEKKLKEYNLVIEEAKNKAKKIFEENRKKLDKDIEEKKKKFNEEVEKEIVSAEKEIIKLKESSTSSVNKIAEEVSSEIIKQIFNTDVNRSNLSAIVQDVSKKKAENNL